MLQVRENDISLRKWSAWWYGAVAHLARNIAYCNLSPSNRMRFAIVAMVMQTLNIKFYFQSDAPNVEGGDDVCNDAVVVNTLKHVPCVEDDDFLKAFDTIMVSHLFTVHFTIYLCISFRLITIFTVEKFNLFFDPDPYIVVAGLRNVNILRELVVLQ